LRRKQILELRMS